MKNRKYTKTHEWISWDGEEATIGITDHAQKLLGDLVYVELPAIGNAYSSGDEIGVVESVKAASDFYAPVSGVVLGVNELVSDNPALINTEPYGQGWLLKMRISRPEELEKLLDETAYSSEIAED